MSSLTNSAQTKNYSFLPQKFHGILVDKSRDFFYLNFMKKNKLIPLIVACANFVICLCLLLFLTPQNVPLVVGIHDTIVAIGSKWWLLIGIIFPLLFLIPVLLAKARFLRLIFTELIIFVTYCNMLGFSFFCSETNFVVGELTKVPLSVAIFLPISLSVFVYGSIIKHIDYKNKLGVVSKNTTTTEFIWKQSHITASYHYMLAGLLLFIVSIVFTFVHHPLIELAIFIVLLIIPRIVVEVGAKKMTNKYNDMKQKEANIKKNKA